MFKKKILDKETIKIKLPTNIKNSKKKIFIKELERKINKTYSYNFKNIIINCNGYPNIYAINFINDFLKFNSLSKFILIKKIILTIFYIKNSFSTNCLKKKYQKAILVHDRHSENYFHWITDVIPKVLWAKRNGDLKKNSILLPSFSSNFQIDSLKEISKNIIKIKKDDKLKITNLQYISEFHPSGFPRPSSLFETKNFYLKNFSASYGSDKIYISRKNSSRRRLINEDELIKVLSKNKFKIVTMENFSFKEQVKIAAGSKVMISAHGAGLTNLLWMKKKSSLIEIRDFDDVTLNAYYVMCYNLGIKYNCYFAKKNILHNITSHYDYEIDLPDFVKKFKDIIFTS